MLRPCVSFGKGERKSASHVLDSVCRDGILELKEDDMGDGHISLFRD